MTAGPQSKTYLLSQRDTTGLVLGLTLVQVMVVGVGMAMMVLMRMAGMGFVATIVPPAIAVVAAKARWRNRFAYEWVGVLSGWVLGRGQRLWWTETPWNGSSGEVPPVLAGVVVTAEKVRAGMGAVVWDRNRAEASMVVSASGLDFEVLNADEQNGLLDDFGRSIGSFATEGNPVVRIGWYEVAVRQSLDTHARFVRAQRTADADADAERRNAYLAMVEQIGSSTTNHDVYVSVTVSSDAVARSSRSLHGRASARTLDDRTVEALDTAVAQLTRGLDDSGISVRGIVTTTELAEIIQRSIDPAKALGLLPSAGRLRNRIGNTARMGPQETEELFRWFATDQALHRSYRLVGFPRTAQQGDWLVKLLSRPEQARTVSVMFEPVPPRQSQREVNKRLAKLDAGETVKLEKGRRISRAEEQAREDVLDLERDLVNGFGVVSYYGIATVSARSVDDLAAASEDFEASAATAGLVLAPCDGEHAKAWALAIPLGLGAAKGTFSP